MSDLSLLFNILKERLGHQPQSLLIENNELTLEIAPKNLLEVALVLREDPDLRFEQLMDLCGVDYLHYGLSEWQTENATFEGFSRATTEMSAGNTPDPHPAHLRSASFGAPPFVGEADRTRPVTGEGIPGSNTSVHCPLPLRERVPEGRVRVDRGQPWAGNSHRFAVVYHLLSLSHNHRIRLKVFVPEENPRLNSVIDIWPSANWYEREAFDLFGFIFENHPDLRRILTDYGFAGHPFRKDFPLSGQVEVHYCEKEKRVLYKPVSIKARTLVPKTIRDDNRYASLATETKSLLDKP